MPLISRQAVGTVCAPVPRQVETVEKVIPVVADAMRPGVIGRDTDAAAEPLLHGKQKAMIAAGAAVIQRKDGSVILSLRRVLLEKTAPLILVSGCRARWVNNAADGARTQSHKLRCIQLRGRDQVNRAVAGVVRRDQPVFPELSL